MKYFIILLVVSLSVVWADETQTPEMNPTAQVFVAGVQTFADGHLTESEKLADFRTEFLNEVANMAQGVETSETYDPASHFQPGDYVTGLTQKVDQILNSADFKNAQFSDIRKDYLKQIADFCMKEYLRDMKEGITQIETADYLNDVDTVARSQQNRISDIQNPPQSVSLYYDPQKSLDTVFGITGKPITSVQWGGVNDNVINSTLVGLLQRIQSRYYTTSTYSQMDFDELTQQFPQGDALTVMQNASTPNVYNTHATVGQSYQIDQYGEITNQFANTSMPVGQVFPPVNDGTYNNRSYGYRYTNGTYTTFSLTMNGRQYTMQETIFTSPLVLDLDGNGKLEASNGQHLVHEYSACTVVEFDMVGDGFLDLTEWVGPNDGLLLVYKQGEEVSANNLFGTAGGFDNGYQKLSLLDKNKDNKLTGEELSTLSVWQDKNVNGIVEQGEVVSVQALGISSIGVDCTKDMVSSFVQNGATKKMWDWYPNVFRVKRTK